MLTIILAAFSLSSETLRAEASPKFMDGVHFACEVAFDSAVEDSAYHQGQWVRAAGSFTLYYWPDQSRLFVGMKLGVSPDGETWRAPSNAYVVNGYRTNLAEQTAHMPGENGFQLFTYDVGGEETLAALARLAGEGVVDIAYTMDGGAMPQTFRVQLADGQPQQWGECVEALVRRDE